MAISTYEIPNGETRWKVYVNIRSKLKSNLRAQRRVFGIKTQREAEREEPRLLRECEREIMQKETQGDTWGSLADQFELSLRKGDASGLSPTSKLDYVAAIRKHTIEWWDRVAVEITRVDIKSLFHRLKADGYSVGHLKKMKAMIAKLFDFGIDHGILNGLVQSPTVGINMGKEEESKPEILTLSEIKTLLHSAKKLKDFWYPIWAMALLTGMRNGELYALDWSDVDFENNKISVNKSYNSRLNFVKSTKAGYWRDVPISSELRTLLVELKESAVKEKRKHVLPHSYKWEAGRQAGELRNFCSGLGLPSVRFHTLRACFATQLIRAGVPPIQIQKICGWKDLKTMQRYIRLAGIEIEGATETLKVLPDIKVFETLGRTYGRDGGK